MPNNYDFSKLENIKTVEINPFGWINPLIIEYGVDFDVSSDYFWRVKGTQHTFVIPVARMNFLSAGNYETHFSEVLEKFGDEYKGWKEIGFATVGWMREYESQYSAFIL
jgi:hypothetical protein